ncbi:MAG: hypothetical protein QXN71_02360 [Candidatus Aenigmatarchaeota archaeon]
MIEVALWGFVGGLLRSLLGFVSHGKPKNKNIPLVLAITGFVGVVSAFAFFYFEGSLYLMVSWKVVFAAVLVGYVGVDLMNSLFEILRKREIAI